MGVKFTNNAYTTLASTISGGATSFDLASAATFPVLAAGDWTYVSLTDEVVKVTAISGVTCTCVAVSGGHSAGIAIELRMTAELLNAFAEDLEAGHKGGDIASASPTVIDTDGDYFDVTGTTSFTAFTVAANRHFFLQFDGVLTMTHHATNLDLPGGADITTAAGDVAEFFSTGADTVQCVNYTKADGTAVVGTTVDATTVTAAGALMDSELAGIVAVKATTGTFLTADQTKLDAIEASATADQTAGEILTLIEDGVDSVHYVDGSIDNEHIADDAIDSEHYVDGSIDNAHIADDAIDSEHYAAASIDGEHLAVGKDGALSLSGAPVDHTANGPQTTTFAAGYTTTLMDLVYLSSAGRWEEADADVTSAAAINLLGVALEVKNDGELMNVALPGSFIQDASLWNFTPGQPVYMGTTDGEITHTKPSGSGDTVRTVGFAVHADMIFFNPSSDYVTLA
jgi:hypothetical protein